MKNMAVKPPVSDILTFVRRVWNNFRYESGLEKRLFSPMITKSIVTENVEQSPLRRKFMILKAQQGSVRFQVPIDNRHTNRLKIVHGGTIASLVDLGGSLAVASHGLWATGVSTDLNVSYLSSGGEVGKMITIQATCDKMGKTLAYTTVKVYTEEGKLAARGSHTKYIKDAYQSQVNNGGPYRYPVDIWNRLKQRVASREKPVKAEEGHAAATATDPVESVEGVEESQDTQGEAKGATATNAVEVVEKGQRAQEEVAHETKAEEQKSQDVKDEGKPTHH